MSQPLVAVIMGSNSDLPTMQGAVDTLKEFGISYELKVVSAHRTPKQMLDYAAEAKGKGFKVIIAGAGGAAHLPGMVASLTTLPVIGVPIQVGKMNGIDSLLSIVQMPKGVPVATMAIDNSINAAIMAARILGLSDENIANRLDDFEKSQIKKVDVMNQGLKS